jgi:hypothetical protein
MNCRRASKNLYSSLLAVGLTAGSMSVYAQDNTNNTRACLQTHHGPAPLLDPALSKSRVRATLQTRPRLPGLSFPDGIATYAAGTKAPGFNKAEEALHCAAESAVSLIAAHIAHVGCGATSYSVAIEAALK